MKQRTITFEVLLHSRDEVARAHVSVPTDLEDGEENGFIVGMFLIENEEVISNEKKNCASR